MLRRLLLAKANELFQERKDRGSIAVLSPTPPDLIDAVLSDLCTTDATPTPGTIFHFDNEVDSPRTSFQEPACLVDIGCGDGRWLLGWASYAPKGSLAFGVDMDEPRLAQATLALQLANGTSSGPLGRQVAVEIICSDYSQVHIGMAAVVVVYLSRFGNEIVKSKIESECAVGTIIIAVGFQMSGWVVDKVFRSPKTGLTAFKYVLGLSPCS